MLVLSIDFFVYQYHTRTLTLFSGVSTRSTGRNGDLLAFLSNVIDDCQFRLGNMERTSVLKNQLKT
jgi:hypothetical protein